MIKRCSICGISLQFTDEINFCRFCRQQFLKITSAKEFIEQGKKIKQSYYVVNTDEPYAEKVFEIIKQGELEKE